MVEVVSCFTIPTLILDFGALMNTWYNGKYDRWREGIEVRYLALALSNFAPASLAAVAAVRTAVLVNGDGNGGGHSELKR